jgi:hypothetical protein
VKLSLLLVTESANIPRSASSHCLSPGNNFRKETFNTQSNIGSSNPVTVQQLIDAARPKRNDHRTMHYDHARHRAEAEALFKNKEDASLEGSGAREVYQANERAMREKTARLRALRLARDQARKRG